MGRAQGHRGNDRTQVVPTPVVGDLSLDCDMSDGPDGGGERLMVLTAKPGSASHDRLRILASWTATTPTSGSKTEIGPGTR